MIVRTAHSRFFSLFFLLFFLFFFLFLSPDPIGLYLAAGLMGEISAILLWSADYTKPAQNTAAAGNAAQL